MQINHYDIFFFINQLLKKKIRKKIERKNGKLFMSSNLGLIIG
mgnify:CR=1 FL=1